MKASYIDDSVIKMYNVTQNIQQVKKKKQYIEY